MRTFETEEELLGAAIATARAHGLKGVRGAPFRDGVGQGTDKYDPTRTCGVCAIGAIALACNPEALIAGESAYKVADEALAALNLSSSYTYLGNDWDLAELDRDYYIMTAGNCRSFDLGAAFAQAMRE